MDEIERARFNMIQQQVRPWDVLDERVLEIMAEVRREDFVPDAYRSLAYADIEIPLANGEFMLAPKVVGRILQALQVQETDKILEIGSGSGYLTACLGKLGGSIRSFEIDPDLAKQARERVWAARVKRANLIAGDAHAGSGDGVTYDVIAVTGSVPREDMLDPIKDQLRIGTGRLFAVIGEDPLMEAELITRTSEHDFQRQGLFETSIPALREIPETESFVF